MTTPVIQRKVRQGSVFADKYLIERELGSGGFSTVYLATERHLERQVALKVLDPAGGETEIDFEIVKERFFQEAQFLGRLSGPHTVRLFDYDSLDDALLYMVLEHVGGEDLDRCLARDGPFETARALAVARQILLGLQEVHALGILHRDLKPSNVMLFETVGEEERVKVLDFGIAKSLAPEGRDLTREGSLVGTLRYLSPEQLLDRQLGPPSDLYAVGLVLYEMLVGESPHGDREVGRIAARMREIPDGLEGMEEIEAGVRRLLEDFLAFEAGDRFERAAEAIEAIDETMEGGVGASGASVAVDADRDGDETTPSPVERAETLEQERGEGGRRPAERVPTDTQAEWPGWVRGGAAIVSVGLVAVAGWLVYGGESPDERVSEERVSREEVSERESRRAPSVSEAVASAAGEIADAVEGAADRALGGETEWAKDPEPTRVPQADGAAEAAGPAVDRERRPKRRPERTVSKSGDAAAGEEAAEETEEEAGESSSGAAGFEIEPVE